MKRLQLKRIKDWKMLPNSRSVTRSSRWGNPYKVSYLPYHMEFIVEDTLADKIYGSMHWGWTKEQAAQRAVELFRPYAIARLEQEPGWLDPLRGLDNLYCTCEEGVPCHADVLIELLE